RHLSAGSLDPDVQDRRRAAGISPRADVVLRHGHRLWRSQQAGEQLPLVARAAARVLQVLWVHVMATIDPRMSDIAQAGRIRLALFLPQYRKDPATSELCGLGTGFLAIELVRSLAERFDIPMQVIEHPTPPKAMESLKSGACDVMLFGI